MRAVRAAAIVVALVLVLFVLGHWSGNQPSRDAVAAAESQLGLRLESDRVPVGELTLHVVQAGPATGAPVVLLHGFPEFWYAWAVPMARLAEAGFRVIVPDLRGYNASDKPRAVEAYQLPRFADDVAGLIGALGHPSAHVAGHDVGGSVAWKLAQRHPERVRRLAVMDTAYPRAWREIETEEETISWYRTLAQVRGVAEWAARAGNWWLPGYVLRSTALPDAFPDEKLDLYRSAWDRDDAFETMAHWYRASARFGFGEPVPDRYGGRVLLLIAPDDPFNPSDVARKSVRYLDDAELVALERGTHWVIQEDPDAVSDALIAFFRE
jgi:pimeloyl-ACP methyl ester carboxylesterase